MFVRSNPNGVGLLFIFLVCICQPAVAKKPAKDFSPVHERVALVIGNGDYSSGNLKNPVNDAASIAENLTDLGFEVEKQFNLKQGEMIETLHAFYQKAKKSKLRLVYFAGHGFLHGSKNYLIPTDADFTAADNIRKSSYEFDELINALDSEANGANIFILDTCRITLSLCPFEPCRGPKNKALDDLSFPKEKKPPKGTLIAYSTGPGRRASDGKNNEHSLYTQILIDLMKRPGLTVAQIFHELNSIFAEQGGEPEQKPQYSDNLSGTEICLKLGPAGECPLIENP